MATPSNLATFTDTYIWIDQQFLMQELFNLIKQDSFQVTANVRAWNGTLRLYSQFFKDEFNLTFPKLTQSQAAQLEQLLSQTGLNVLHIVQYQIPGLTRLYDSSTPSGYGVNTDVNRIRNKIWFDKWSIPHWPNQAGFYNATLHGIEA